MKRASLLEFGNLSSYKYNIDTYDSSKLGLGLYTVQKNDVGNEGKWVGPCPSFVSVIDATGLPFLVSDAIEYIDSPSTGTYRDLVFLGDGASAAATRKIVLCTHDHITGSFTYNGFITLTFPTATAHTIRAMRATLDRYTTGTVSVSGTAVTGASSLWSTSRIPSGCRIGFGSTNASAITTWYEISAVGSDTSITLTSSAGTIAAGTPYVIEDLRLIVATTNATTTNGGLYLVKGLRPEIFTAIGTTISAATTVDGVRAVYWLKSATTETLTNANGCDFESFVDWNNHNVWVGHGTTTQTLYKFNMRAALTLTGGAATNAFTFKTAASATLTGTNLQQQSMVIATTSSTTGGGVPCIYFTTNTLIYRTKPISTITTGDTTFVSSGDNQTPKWPAGNFGFSNPGSLYELDYDSSLDMFAVHTTASGATRILLSKYRSDNTPMDRMMFGVDHSQYQYHAAAMGATGGYPDPHCGTGSCTTVVDGMLYISSASSVYGGLACISPAADWEYASIKGSYVVTPIITLTNPSKINYVTCGESRTLGTATSTYNLSPNTLPYRMKYRTSGMTDNTGAWTDVDQSGKLDIAGVTQIQFRFEFRTIGMTTWTSRIHSLTVVYDDNTTIDNYQFSGSKSDPTNKKFVWRFAKGFSSTVPTLKVELYNVTTAASPVLLVSDNTASPTGTFEKSTNGTTWSAYDTTDKTNDTTYIRYTPASLADGILVEARLLLN